MCQSFSSTVKRKIEVVAPCGAIVMVYPTREMRDPDLINSEKLIKNARKFFKELGFIGDCWKVKVTTTKETRRSGGLVEVEDVSVKVFC